MQYLPRMAVFMWFISMALFTSILISPTIGREELITIGIFPMLILILLAEGFLDVQITSHISDALRVTIETLIVAIVCYQLMATEILQRLVLLYPEGFTLGILLAIFIIERYRGLRLMEVWRYRKLLQ